MAISLVQEQDPGAWDRLTAELDASALISTRWLTAVGAPERRPLCLRVVVGARTIGAIGGLIVEPSLPLLRRFGRRLFFYSGPALQASEAGAIPQAVGVVVDYARERGMASVDFRSWDYPCVFDPPESMPYRCTRPEYFLDLRGDLNEINARMRPRIQEQVKQSLRAGLTFHEAGSPEAVDELMGLLEATRAIRISKGRGRYSYFFMPYLSPHALRRLIGSGLARIFYARKDTAVVSAMIAIVSGKRAIALLIGSAEEGYRLKAPTLVWFETIQALKREGVVSFNLGGVPSGSDAGGLAFYKGSFGAEKKDCVHGATRLMRRSPLHLLTRLVCGK